ncbi:DUF3006 domain-containing protein [Thermosinus carboxydivorans]|nr:DUF3006 domain-containing protein [Thermosinus carboxydivorans]
MQLRAVIDRFEDEKAVLLVGDEEEQVLWPRCLLPAGAREGDILTMALAVDGDATRAAREEAETILRRLLGQE